MNVDRNVSLKAIYIIEFSVDEGYPSHTNIVMGCSKWQCSHRAANMLTMKKCIQQIAHITKTIPSTFYAFCSGWTLLLFCVCLTESSFSMTRFDDFHNAWCFPTMS